MILYYWVSSLGGSLQRGMRRPPRGAAAAMRTAVPAARAAVGAAKAALARLGVERRGCELLAGSGGSGGGGGRFVAGCRRRMGLGLGPASARLGRALAWRCGAAHGQAPLAADLGWPDLTTGAVGGPGMLAGGGCFPAWGFALLWVR